MLVDKAAFPISEETSLFNVFIVGRWAEDDVRYLPPSLCTAFEAGGLPDVAGLVTICLQLSSSAASTAPYTLFLIRTC